LSPVETRTALLCAECRRDWEAVRKHAERARSTDPTNGEAQAALVALSLDHAYQGFESILVRLERAAGLPERTGASWHPALLADAALVIPGVRPPLFPPEALSDWDAVMRFRHFLRHAVVVNLDAGKFSATTERLERAVQATEPWLEAVLFGLMNG
jgi:hypothetical protein